MDIAKTVDGILSSIYRDYVKLLKYLSVGIVGTIADWTVFAILIGYTSLVYALAMAVSYFIGTIINYTLNRRYTFNSTYRKVHYQFFSFAAIALVGFGIQEALMYGMVHFMLSDTDANHLLMACRVITTFVAFVWTFIANKKITFKVFK